MKNLQRKRERLWRKLEMGFRRLLLVIFLVSLFFLILYKRQNPSLTPLMPIRFVDQIIDGRKIVLKFTWVPIEQMSDNIIYGAMAGEDQKFLEHRGVDGDALRDAFVYNVKHQTISLGGSTITQQTAKNVFLRPDRSLLRKGAELYFALMMELLRSKERIMEVYLNIIEFGDGIYGVEQAARYYFDTSAAKLTQSQASFLVAIMPNPRYYQNHRYRSRVTRRKSTISRSITTLKRNKEIKSFVEQIKQ